MSTQDSFPSSIDVDGFTVHKLRLSEYALVFEKLQKLPVLLSEFTNVDNAQIIAALPRLVSVALPEVLDILAIATGKTKEELDDTMDIKTAVRCLKAVFQVNDFFALWQEIQTVLPDNATAKSPQVKKT